MKGSGVIGYALLALLCGAANAQSNVDPARPYAWCENVGWLDVYAGGGAGLFVPVEAGAASGYGWLENAGWVNFGDGTPAAGAAYGNSIGEDSGLNHDGNGGLYGLAWGENIGWINFGTAGQPRVTVDGTGQLHGYAWGENVGWISFETGAGVVVNFPPPEGEGAADGATEGDGAVDGEGGGEGSLEGTSDGEGAGEGSADGEGAFEGELPQFHSADYNGSGRISLQELLRVVQLYNAGALSCVTSGETDDGYQPYAGDQNCARHSSDYTEPRWVISLSELLRAIQLFAAGGYMECGATEDRFCPIM